MVNNNCFKWQWHLHHGQDWFTTCRGRRGSKLLPKHLDHIYSFNKLWVSSFMLHPCRLLPQWCQEPWKHFPPTPDQSFFFFCLTIVGRKDFHHSVFSKLYPCKSLHLSPVRCMQNGWKQPHSQWYANIAVARLTAGTVLHQWLTEEK